MKIHVRVFVLLASVSIIAPLAARAQTWGDSLSREDRFWGRTGGQARQLALGGGGFGIMADTGIKTLGVNPYTVDPMFMLNNPAYASNYQSLLWFDGGITTNSSQEGFGQQFGGTFSTGGDITLGLILGRSDAEGFNLVNPNIFQQVTHYAHDFTFFPPSNTWEVMGSVRAGSMDIGLGVSYATSSANTTGQSVLDTTSRFANFHQLGISAGLLIHGSDGMLLDLGGNVIFPGISSGTSTPGDLSVTSVGINARAFLPIHKDFYLVPIANLYLASGTSTFLATPKDLPSSTSIDVGVGVNFWQGGIHIMSGVSAGFYQQNTPAIANVSPTLANSQTILPRWNIGAEWPIVKWFTARLGYFASSGSETRQAIVSTTSVSSVTLGQPNLYSPLYGFSPSGISLGGSFDIAHFALDVTITQGALHAPFSIFGDNGPFGFITFSYRFD